MAEEHVSLRPCPNHRVDAYGSLFIFGISRLETTTSHIYLERFAKSFDFINADELELEIPTRLSVEPLYQYQRLWLIAVPLSISGYLITARVPQCPAEKLIPELVMVYRSNARIMGFLLLSETSLRVALEIIWRYFRMNTKRIPASETDN